MQRPHPAGRFEVDRAAGRRAGLARNALIIQARRSVWPRPGIYQMLPSLQTNQLARPTTQAFQAKPTGVHFFQAPHWARLGDSNRARTLSAGKDKQVKGIVKVASHVAPPRKERFISPASWLGDNVVSLQTRGRSPEQGAVAPQPESPLCDRGTVRPHRKEVQVTHQKAPHRRRNANALNGKQLGMNVRCADLFQLRNQYVVLTRS
jgi:hypothetical protein